MGSTIQRLPKFSRLNRNPMPLALRVVPWIRSGLTPWVVHNHLGGDVAVNEQPVARASGPLHQPAVEVAAGHRDTADDLLLDQLEVSVLHQPGCDAEMGEGLDLSVRVGGITTCLLLAVYDDKVLHHRQVLVIAIGALERARPDGLQQHGAARREAGSIPLGQLRRIALAEPRHTHQRVGVTDRAFPSWGIAVPLIGGPGAPPIG